MEVFSLQKVVKMLEDLVIGWQEVRWVWWMRQNFVAQFTQLLKCWLCNMQLGIIVENWALSVDQCWLQVLQFLVHLIDLLSSLLRCNGLAGFRKLQQTTEQWPRPFCWCKFGFGNCSGAASQSSHWARHCQLSYNIHFSSHITIRSRKGSLLSPTIREDNTSKWRLFWFLVSSWDTHLSSFLTFPICFKRRMTIEWSTWSSSAASCVSVLYV